MNSKRTLLASRWFCPALLCALALGVFWRYFLLDQTLYAGDTAFVFVPFRQFLTNHLAQGRLPLWNPTLFGGTPALAESQYQVFYPINFLMVVVGAARGMGWILALHLAWMAVGTFAFLRQSLALSRVAALFGAVAFAFGTCVQSRLSIPVYTDAAAWLPWILWGYERARTRGGAWIIAAPIALALQLCTGAAQYSYYTLALLLAFHLFFSRFEATRARKTSGWIVLGFTLLMGVLLSMAQLLPELELARLSNRGTSASYAFAVAGSLSPRHFALTSLFPKFLGLYSTAPLDGFLASSESGFLGAATLALLGAATAYSRHARVWFWFGCALVSLSLAFGGHNPLYPLLFRVLPGTSTFRGPGNWLLIVSFCGATLAAMGLHAVFENLRAARLRAFVVAMSCLGAALLVALSPLGAGALVSPDDPNAKWLQIGVFAAVAVLCALAWKTPRALLPLLSARRIGIAFLVLLVGDLALVSQDMELNHTVLSSDLEITSPAVTRLQAANTSPAPERFWSENADKPLEPWQRNLHFSAEETVLFRGRQGLAMRSLMPSCVASQNGAFGLTGAWGALMPLRRHAQPLYDSQTSPALKQRWLRLLNTRFYLSFEAPGNPELTPVSTIAPAIYRDNDALPRAFWVGKAVPTTMDTALSVVSGAGFDPRREVALENGAGAVAASGAPREPQAATFSRYEENRLELEVNAPARGVLVVMDTFYPGWHARVDGRETPILPANFVGRAVEVAGGTHRVEMWFEPQSVRLGVFVSLLALAILAGVATATVPATTAAARRAGRRI